MAIFRTTRAQPHQINWPSNVKISPDLQKALGQQFENINENFQFSFSILPVDSTNLSDTTNIAYLNAENVFSLIDPLTTPAESWIGPSATDGIYFKSGNVGIGTTNPTAKLEIAGGTLAAVVPGPHIFGTATGSKYSAYDTRAAQLFIGGAWNPVVADTAIFGGGAFGQDTMGLSFQPTITPQPNTLGINYVIGSYLAVNAHTASTGAHEVIGTFIDSPPVVINGTATLQNVTSLYVENVYGFPTTGHTYAIHSVGRNLFAWEYPTTDPTHLLSPIALEVSTGQLVLSRGAITAAESSLTRSVTWNGAGVTFIADQLTVTDTTSAAGSLLAKWIVGADTMFSVSKVGNLAFPGTLAANSGGAGGTNVINGATNSGSGLWAHSGAGPNVQAFQIDQGYTVFNRGTVTDASVPGFQVNATWNLAGGNFLACKVNITDTSSGAHAKLLALQIAGSERFSIEKNGNVLITDASGDAALVINDKNSNNANILVVQYAGSQMWTFETNGGTAAHYNGFSVPHAWLQSNTEQMRLDTSGRLGVGVTSPTARIHVKAGTATANTAPFKFNSGTVLTTAEAGALEFTTDDFFATITTGAARKAFILDDGARLTSGKIPIASTNGRLIDGQTPLTGTKVYYVSDTSGGGVTRKLTFIDGILTAET